jgi:hypothetical protein
MESNNLRIIGYWHSLYEPDFPDPASFIDKTWEQSIKKEILTYLRNGYRTPVINLGSSWCRFRCGMNSLGSSEFTDGNFVWPEGLEHYIEYHDIKLPQNAIEEMLSGHKKSIIKLDEEAFLNIDANWWKQQKGWSTSEKSFRDLTDIGTLTIFQIDKNKITEQNILLKEFLFKAQDVPQKLRQIKNILSGNTVTLKGRFIDYDLFKINALKVGLSTNFTELTYLDYRDK